MIYWMDINIYNPVKWNTSFLIKEFGIIFILREMEIRENIIYKSKELIKIIFNNNSKDNKCFLQLITKR